MNNSNSVVARIQHHQSRDHLLPPILEALEPLSTEIITDPSDEDRNPWRNYKNCLSDLPDSSHLVVLQDDVIVCRNFAPAVERIAEANPDVPVCLFLGGLPQRTGRNALRAAKLRRPYAELWIRDFCPVVSVLWPTHKATEFMEWAAGYPSMPGYTHPKSDDAVCGRWVLTTRQTIRVTVPSLVQHPDEVESLIGKRAKAGKDKGRVALMWLGTEADPLEIDWTAI